MQISDCAFLDNELLDVVRLFKNQPRSLSHTFSYEEGFFYNRFTVDGEEFCYKEAGQVQDEIVFKRLERRYAKLALYEILAQKTGEKMPWGALTGIRPTKLAYREKEEGREFAALFEKMHVSLGNTRLIADILRAQEGIYDRTEGSVDLFVSLPFCPSKCAYCSFITAPIEKTREFLPDYLTALKKELQSLEGSIKNLRSLYIGGGTPFALSAAELRTVLEAAAPLYKEGVEYTVEAGRPDVFTKEKLDLLKEFGVTRICINPQTFDDDTLKRIGRKHTTEQTLKAFEMAEDYDFSVNLDLIAGLHGESV
ncbi:MAG: radical SAM protein, partial [Clostridia bacterium]|nr:radical SAM protein [Clostridia bacterium]